MSWLSLEVLMVSCGFSLEIVVLSLPLCNVLVSVIFQSRITINDMSHEWGSNWSGNILCMSLHEAEKVIITKVEVLLKDL